MLTASQLTDMQVTQNANLPDLVDIARPQKTASNIGSIQSDGETVISTDVACRVTPAQMLETLGQQARPIETDKYIMRLPVGTNVKDRDTLTITTKGNLKLRVERVKEPRSYDTLITVECEIHS